MKYSQAALIACLGGAALASAIPTGHTAAPSAHAPTTPANRRTRTQRIGKGTAESLRTLASYAKGVNGQSYPPSTETETYTGDNQVQRLQRRARGRHRASAKHRLSSIGSNLKGAEAAASEAAGGRVALANDLGTVVNLVTTPSDSTLTMRHRDAAAAAEGDSDSAAPSHSSSSTPVDKSRGRTQQPSTNDQKKDKWRARKHPSNMPSPPHPVTDKADKALAARAMYEDDTLSLRDLEQNLLSSRDLDEEPFAREVAEELVARGIFKTVWNIVRGKKHAEAPSPAVVPSVIDTTHGMAPFGSGDPNASTSTVHKRDLIEDRDLHEDFSIRQLDDRLVEGREFDDHHLLSSRDFDSDAELFARELAEGLVERGRFTNAWNALRGKHTEAPSPAAVPVPSVIDTSSTTPYASEDPKAVYKREHMINVNEGRDFDEDLSARELEELVARHRHWREHMSDYLKRPRWVMVGVDTHTRDHKNIPMVKRDFIEDLDAREFDIDELD